MATKTTTIEDRTYRLHSTKAEGSLIGYVPVLEAKSVKELLEVYPEDLIVRDFHQGCAVRLQAMARNCAKSSAITKADFSRIASILLKEDVDRYAGNYNILEKDVEALFREEQDDTTADSEHVWTELL